MSPRRALATAIAMAIVPASLFFVGVSRYSEQTCRELRDKWEVTVGEETDIQKKCTKIVKSSQWRAFYLILIASILANWPVIRWLDDRQWYREWIKSEERE